MMSTQPPASSQKLDFAPLHRTTELENIHAQVIKNDLQTQESNQSPTTRKMLVRHLTVIGDGSDIDSRYINTQ